MLHGGRWNSRGLRAIYAAETYSGALLEVLVHSNLSEPPKNHRVIRIDIPGQVEIETVSTTEVPDWDAEDSLGNDAYLFYQQLLLAKLQNSDCSEVSKNLHDAEVSLTEGYLPTVCQDVNGTPCFVRLPWKHKTVGYETGIDSRMSKDHLVA